MVAPLAGGIHASATADHWLLRARPVDGLAPGEGELSCLEWLRSGGAGVDPL